MNAPLVPSPIDARQKLVILLRDEERRTLRAIGEQIFLIRSPMASMPLWMPSLMSWKRKTAFPLSSAR